ncbi:protease inhibitor I42 family protein [Klebsiella aerogenes]|uniref:protease inhibitor I42 family protein n=1 Tax=Klebsiella aerogenes TaxID=548 RepID=UPI0009BBEC14
MLRKLPDNIVYVDSQYEEDATCQSKKLLGCGDKTTIHFIAVSSGLSQIELQYAQPWEPLPKEKIIYIIIVV